MLVVTATGLVHALHFTIMTMIIVNNIYLRGFFAGVTHADVYVERSRIAAFTTQKWLRLMKFNLTTRKRFLSCIIYES